MSAYGKPIQPFSLEPEGQSHWIMECSIGDAVATQFVQSLTMITG